MADDPTSIFGTYAAHPDSSYVTTPVDGLSRLSVDTQHAAGCNDPACRNYSADAVRTAVEGAEFVVVCLGLGTDLLSLYALRLSACVNCLHHSFLLFVDIFRGVTIMRYINLHFTLLYFTLL